MARLCERPGCSAPAACEYAIEPKRLRVRIEPLAGDGADGSVAGHRAGVLCRRHADSMVVPLGWTLDDRRPVERRTAASATAQPPPSVPRRPAPRRERVARRESGSGGVEQLALLSMPADLPEVRPAPAVPAPTSGSDRSDDSRSDVVEVAAVEVEAVAMTGDLSHAHVDAASTPVVGARAGEGGVVDDGSVAATAAEAEEDAADPAAARSETDESPADPWRPVFDQTDDLGGLLTARSPLLARAFGRRERQAAAPDAGD